MNPIMNSLILYFVFRAIFKIQNLGGIDFFSYVYSGVILLTFFTQSVAQSSEQITDHAEVLRQIRIPAETFILAKILSNLVNFTLSCVPLALYFILTGHGIDWNILFILLMVLSLMLHVIAFSILLSVLYVRYQDLKQLVPLGLSLLYFTTPIFYSLEMLGGNTKTVLKYNPLAKYLETFRSSLNIDGSIDLKFMAIATLFGLVSMYLALRYFEKKRSLTVLLS